MKEHITTFDLSRYLEKDLEESEARNIEKHCSTCETCMHELDFMKRMISCTAMLKDSKVSDISEFVKQTIQKKNKPLRKIVSLRHMLLPASAAAALFIIAGSGLFMDHYSSKPIKVSMDFSAVQPEQPRVDYEDVVGTSTSLKSIVSTLKSNGAKVTKFRMMIISAFAASSALRCFLQVLSVTRLILQHPAMKPVLQQADRLH
jgi:hypothetical protein